ncbi:MAG: hypothetical protein C0599_04050 [Salinivirgaceae bacterium]|nr:MAG: hypothetical protein C0599_04050 [Salinivirgaceae bacterium]
MKNQLILILFIFISSSVFSQVSNTEQPYVEVYGTAEKEIVPNEIYINVNLKEKGKTRDSKPLKTQVSDLKGKLHEIGIPNELISMSDAGANYIKVSWSHKDVISSANFTILVATAEEVANVFKVFDDLDIHGAYINHTSHSDIEFLRKKVRIEAVKAAKEKATYMLEALGNELGEPLVLKETSPAGVGMMVSNVAMEQPRQAYQSKMGGVIQFRKIKIQSTVFAKFVIK